MDNFFFYPGDSEIVETWIVISSFKYFQVIRIEKQIRLFVLWEKLWLNKCFKIYWPLVSTNSALGAYCPNIYTLCYVHFTLDGWHCAFWNRCIGLLKTHYAWHLAHNVQKWANLAHKEERQWKNWPVHFSTVTEARTN